MDSRLVRPGEVVRGTESRTSDTSTTSKSYLHYSFHYPYLCVLQSTKTLVKSLIRGILPPIVSGITHSQYLTCRHKRVEGFKCISSGSRTHQHYPPSLEPFTNPNLLYYSSTLIPGGDYSNHRKFVSFSVVSLERDDALRVALPSADVWSFSREWSLSQTS